MGVYNISNIATIDQMMSSVLNQTYPNIEFIICDDGSTDETYSIIKSYADNDSRIVLIKNEKNMGLAYSLDKCIQASKGEYIARQDADDISEKTRLEKQIDFLKNHPEIAFVGSNVYLYDKDVWGTRTLKDFPKKEDFLFNSAFVHGTIVFRKSAINSVGNYKIAKETYRLEDYNLFMRMYEQNLYGANIQENLYYYQENKDNMAKRKYKYRIDEVKVRYDGFKRLKLFPKGYIYIIKPLIVGLIPQKILMKLKIHYNVFKEEK